METYIQKCLLSITIVCRYQCWKINIYAAFVGTAYLSAPHRSWQPFSYLTGHVRQKNSLSFEALVLCDVHNHQSRIKWKHRRKSPRLWLGFFHACLMSLVYLVSEIIYDTVQRSSTEACWLPLSQAPQRTRLGWARAGGPARRAPAPCCCLSEGTARLVARTFVQHRWNATPNVCLGKV